MKPIIRSFAIGLLTATLIIGVFFYLTEEKSVDKSNLLSEEDMLDNLEDSGYFIYSEDMEQKLTEHVNKAKNEATEENDNEENHAPKLVYYNISIDRGMSVSDVASKLVEKEVISNENRLIEYLENEELSHHIQIGSFEIHNQMSIEEITNAITNP
ncbi:endolytic transglycosylase MltG [Gracilibacillus sp. YIM 98692]|uniref:endolytic transglycosylase MltG n=1 Tax=Gracilibacillus sp. YIM 98692 TaxID=2663532 RepID=UPI0013D2C62F|nr:endolytic transglycosylase MltG [Gracilibacillus sp. YIM 98692]